MKRVYLFAVLALLVWCFPVSAAPPSQCANGNCPRVASAPRAVAAVAKSRTVAVVRSQPVRKLFRPFRSVRGGCGY
jgi:hypothetical protein